MSPLSSSTRARLRTRIGVVTALGLALSGLAVAPAVGHGKQPGPPVHAHHKVKPKPTPPGHGHKPKPAPPGHGHHKPKPKPAPPWHKPKPAPPGHGHKPKPPVPVASPSTSEYLPGVEADLYLPRTKARSVPLVVLVPGGGWQSSDRSGLGQLAEALAEKGVAVSNATYRIGNEESLFPVPAQDISCAIDAAVASVKKRGLKPRQIVVVGHSAGAHLSSLSAFAPEKFRSDACPYPRNTVDGWVGLSGFYDLPVVEEMATPMMGGPLAERPEAWDLAQTTNHLAESGRRQHLDVLLVQGDQDEFGITVEYAEGLGQLMRDRGYRTTVVPVPGGDHNVTYQAPVVAKTILRWLCTVNP